jgi:hypothetical protein
MSSYPKENQKIKSISAFKALDVIRKELRQVTPLKPALQSTIADPRHHGKDFSNYCIFRCDADKVDLLVQVLHKCGQTLPYSVAYTSKKRKYKDQGRDCNRDLSSETKPKEVPQWEMLLPCTIVQAAAFALAMNEVIADHWAPFIELSFLQQTDMFRTLCTFPLDSFVKYAKYITVYPMAKYMHQVPPESPPGFLDFASPLVWSGPVRKYLKARLMSCCLENDSLFNGILQGVKRAAAPVPDSYLRSTCQKHADTLKAEPRGVPVTQEWKDVYDSIFARMPPAKPKLLEASGGACAEFPRGWGGQRGYIQRYLMSNQHDPDALPEFKLTPKLNRFGDRQPLYVKVYDDYEDGTSELVSVYFEPSLGWSSEPIRGELLRIDYDGPKYGTVPVYGYPQDFNIYQMVNHLYCEKSALRKKRRLDNDALNQILQSMGLPPKPLPNHVFPATEAEANMFGSPDKVWQEGAWGEGDNQSYAVAIGLLEPLKVRMITKGPAKNYYISKFFQKHMWKHMKSIDSCKLIGEVLNEENIEEISGSKDPLLDPYIQEFDHYVSGDYSSATDGLDIRHTNACFESALSRPFKGEKYQDLDTFRLRERLRNVLDCHRISYSPKMKVDTIDQNTGQLMGSPLSFPILCAINMATYMVALKRYISSRRLDGYKVEITPYNIPILVNGDDILFRANAEFYEFWQNAVREVGFELSLGKNYFHRTLLTVNSQLYRRSSGKYKKVPFLNVGLLNGQCRSTGRKAARDAPIWDLHRETIEGAQNKGRAHRRFVHYHKDEIQEMTQCHGMRLNLFIDRWRGGLGFTQFEGFEEHNHYTYPQKLLAQALYAYSKEKFLNRENWRVGYSVGVPRDLYSGNLGTKPNYGFKYLMPYETWCESKILLDLFRKPDTERRFPPNSQPCKTDDEMVICTKRSRLNKEGVRASRTASKTDHHLAMNGIGHGSNLKSCDLVELEVNTEEIFKSIRFEEEEDIRLDSLDDALNILIHLPRFNMDGVHVTQLVKTLCCEAARKHLRTKDAFDPDGRQTARQDMLSRLARILGLTTTDMCTWMNSRPQVMEGDPIQHDPEEEF